jgi:hypothetical protein
MRCLTERIAKRIRRGKPWGKSAIPDGLILDWALHYAILRSFEAYCPTIPYPEFMYKMWTEYAVNR